MESLVQVQRPVDVHASSMFTLRVPPGGNEVRASVRVKERMSARYRIKEHKHTFTPQKRVLGMWFNIARPQASMQAASEIIRQKLKVEHPGPPPPPPDNAGPQNQE